MRIRPYRDQDLERAEALWRACNLVVPYNDPGADIAFCRSTGHGEVFVGEDERRRIVATVMAGHDGHRGWIYYLAVDPEHQRGGLGKQMMRHAEAWLHSLGVRKVQLLIRESNNVAQGFYDRLGYERSPVIVMQRWLIPPRNSGN
jgi:ribosomal protein S18 acetylase RimI-like enzyme